MHRHRQWRPGAMTVEVGCREFLRVPARTARGVPAWEAAWLWRHAHTLAIDPDAAWAPFGLDLHAGLPPATEARTIAWRYEIVVRRRMRGGHRETAVRTPLLHEELSRARGLGASPVSVRVV